MQFCNSTCVYALAGSNDQQTDGHQPKSGGFILASVGCLMKWQKFWVKTQHLLSSRWQRRCVSSEKRSKAFCLREILYGSLFVFLFIYLFFKIKNIIMQIWGSSNTLKQKVPIISSKSYIYLHMYHRQISLKQ